MAWETESGGGDPFDDEARPLDEERELLRAALHFEPSLDEWPEPRAPARRDVLVGDDDEAPATSYLETIVEDMDRKLEKLLHATEGQDAPAGDLALAVRVVLAAVRQEFGTLRHDV